MAFFESHQRATRPKKIALGKARLLVVRAERLVYLSEWSTRRIVIRLEFAERRLEFTIKRERDVDLDFQHALA